VFEEFEFSGVKSLSCIKQKSYYNKKENIQYNWQKKKKKYNNNNTKI
jgi:hypothetical protein